MVGGLSHHDDAHTSSTVIGRREILAHDPAASEALLRRRVEVVISEHSGGGADQVVLHLLVVVPPTSAGHPTAEVLPRAAPQATVWLPALSVAALRVTYRKLSSRLGHRSFLFALGFRSLSLLRR
jgi:hypothetical protein